MQIASLVVGRSYEALEAKTADSDFQVIENTLRGVVEAKTALMMEYGRQDAVHDYMSGQAAFPISEATLTSSLMFANADLIGFFGPEGLRTGVARNVNGARLGNITDLIDIKDPAWSELLDRMQPGFAGSAVLNSDSGLYFVLTMPIIRSEAEGAYVGHIVIGCKIDPDFIDAVKTKTMSLGPFQGKVPSGWCHLVSVQGQPRRQVLIIPAKASSPLALTQAGNSTIPWRRQSGMM